jgi:hypothetical protein
MSSRGAAGAVAGIGAAADRIAAAETGWATNAAARARVVTAKIRRKEFMADRSPREEVGCWLPSIPLSTQIRIRKDASVLPA